MNFKGKQWIVTSKIYRWFRYRPEKKFDEGVTIYTSVFADDEETAKKIAEDNVCSDFFVDAYEFVRIELFADWDKFKEEVESFDPF